MHTQAAPMPSYHIPGGFEHLYRSSSLTIYSDNEEEHECARNSNGYLADNSHSYPDCMYGKLYKSKCLSGSLSSSQSDDSLEGRAQSLEDHHFQKALNQGVFNGVSAYNKRERKRSFRRVRKKSHSESSCEDDTMKTTTTTTTTSSRHLEMMFSSRALGGSSNLGGERESGETRRRKESIPKRGERFRKELSNCGIDLHDANDKMNIEEIYQLQQRFFTGLKIRAENNNTNNDDTDDMDDGQLLNNGGSPQRWIKKKRCASSIN